MADIQIFKNNDFGSVRTIEENGQILFCGTDVARALGYSNPRDAIIRHCRGVVKRDGVYIPGVLRGGILLPIVRQYAFS